MDARNNFFKSYKKKIEEKNSELENDSSKADLAEEGDQELTPTAEDINGKPASADGEKSGVIPKEEEGSGLKFKQESGFKKPKQQAPPSTANVSNRNKRVLGIVIGSVAIIAVIIGFILLFNRGIEAIDLAGWTENDAQLWAKDNGVNLQVDKEFSDTVEAGKIISQSIAQGTRIKKGSFIKVLVSMGHDLTVTLPLPDIMSMTKEQVEAWAAENFMAKVRITGEFSEEVPLGGVIRYEINDPSVVDEVNRNTPIYVIVSKGPEDEGAAVVEIPNFKEMAIGESYAFANENDIVLNVVEEYDDYVPEGIVISQSVKPEEKVNKGTEIILVVSKGKLITIPDFSGYSKEKANAVAAELGIPITIEEKYSGAPPDAFISQSIKEGTEYNKGDILELVYSIDNKIVLPSFVGQTRDAMEAWAKEFNSQGAGITIKATNTKSNSPKGTILYQDKSNTVIGIKTSISITVSQGKVIYVPDFVAASGSGYDKAITREKAIAMCEELNIVPVFKSEKKKGRLPGEVWSQSIEAGKEMTEGSTITLKHVPADTKVKVPDFKGKTKTEVLAGDYNKNFDIRFIEGTEFVEGFEGKVCDQSAQAGSKAAAGSTITLTIGPPDMMSPGGVEDTGDPRE
ncbi:MAG: PASTA domain-containing protein [Clostridiales bacterium]|nr:PASTA domain-containing protein [Clostridiales bacterium]